MQNQSTRWMISLTSRINGLLLCLSIGLCSAFVWAQEEEDDQVIEYEVTAVEGYLYGTIDGETAYKNWRRGTFDKERMVEIKPRKIKKELPKPVVVPFTAPKVSEVPVGQPKKPPLKGEDKIFVQIGKDEVKARCFILGEGCEALLEPKDEKDSIYFPAIDKAKERRAQEEEESKKREIISP